MYDDLLADRRGTALDPEIDMTDDPSDNRLQKFYEQLRSESERGGPGSGLGRFARTARGAVGIAANVWKMRGRPELDDKGLLKIEHLAERLGELKGVPMAVPGS